MDAQNVSVKKLHTKRYLNENVFVKAQERISYVFDNFENIYVSFSGGKDSGVVLSLTLEEAKKRNRKIGVLFIDLEAFYKKTIDYIEQMITENIDYLDPYWVCLPMESENSLSYLDPTWIWWDKEKESIWVREMPTNPWVINEENNTFNFYQKNMPFEEFVKYFAEWYGKGNSTACLVGIRTVESLNRYRAITGIKTTFNEKQYSTKVNNNNYNFYPIYDWAVEDIWTYYGKFSKPYNKLYDLFYRAGISIHKMRVDEPFGNEAKAGLSLFKVIEPETWGKVVNRVSGANFGNIYGGTKIMSHNYKLPKNHTWKSFCKFLLNTLPPSTAENYRRKFKRFIWYWHRVGCPLSPGSISILMEKYPDYVVNTHEYSNRGFGDKEVIKFRKIIDELHELDGKMDILTWRRMAMAIIKNDLICRSLSFGITKNWTKRQDDLIKRYSAL